MLLRRYARARSLDRFQQLVEAVVGPGLVRISVGLEDPDDIVYDLDQALTKATEGK